MKRFILGFAFSFLCFAATYATTWTVHVKNFQFSPATVNAVVGDVIQWVWDNGSHTTTSTSVPAGAGTWNSVMNSTNKTFSYTLTVAGTYSYHCTPHAPEMAGTLTVTEVMPVEFTNFNVTTTSGNKALISWNTVTEQNAAYFSIKKSTDGSTFTEIARINAAGNSTTLKTYSFTDIDIASLNKYLYYSIEIVDKDGRRQVSPIKLFKNNAAVIKLIAGLSPNPISSPGHLMLQFNADKAGSMTAKLYDANGKFIKQADMGAEIGLNNGHFHLGNLPAGVYTIVFTMDNLKETKTIVVQ
ncbi:MAG TPA: plastocyanin/azurin family copper-binding protein [Panacibacter sp.]|nr:plastocyanin/azurin family copper-binding protein [Panacibacter sp.]